MAVVADGGGGGPSVDYESFNGPDVKVNITDLVSFYLEMLDVQTDATGPATMTLSPMAQMIREGLEQPTDAGPFPEGVYAARLLRWRLSDFQHFVDDVLDGIRNIGSAAAVIAEIYENADSESAADINDVAFAFGDPGATAPPGFRSVESWSEYERRMAEQSGEMLMAAQGDDSHARVYHVANGVTLYIYPDGSTKMVTVTTKGSDSSYQSDSTIITTTIYAPGGKVVSTTTEERFTTYGGAKVERTTTTQGDEQNGTTSTTSTVTDSTGRVTVTNETTVRTNGEERTTRSDPVTVDPGDRGGRADAEAGPIEQAVEQLDTYGEDYFVEEFGRGY